MKNECDIVRDLLPLYAEDMTSPRTRAFVAEHLRGCPDCRAEYEAMGSAAPPAENPEQADPSAGALKKLKKKLRRKTALTALITALCLALLIGLVHFFPVHRLASAVLPWPGWFDTDELAMLAYIGSREDRAEAGPVMALAELAFSDASHTREENESLYGKLSIYAVSTDSQAASQTHTLKLWSAHFDEDRGYMWVYYSSERFDELGNAVSAGPYSAAALWTLEKSPDGSWTVSAIKQIPHGG